MPNKNLQIDQNKLREKFVQRGVKMIAPETIFFSKETVIGKNVTIEPYVVFSEKVKIGNNVIVKSFSHLEGVIVENNVEIGPYARIRPDVRIQRGSKIGNFVEIKKSNIGKNSKVNHLSYIGDTNIGKKVKIGNNVTVKSFSHLEGVIVENNVEIGPYARIRPEVRIQKGSKIGNFVEIKKSNIGKNSKVNHLSYIGDTTIGKNVNIGAGTITCNYDGVKKSKTNIKDGVFIGSNSSLVAPVTINKSSIVGASSVITKDVLPKSLALTRSNQITIKNYKRKK